MNVPVTLAGFPAAWRFRDSAELDAWLGTLPWCNRGGVRVVRIASPELAVEMTRAIRRAVRGHDDGDTDVQVRIADGSLAGEGLRALLHAVLDVPPREDRRAFFNEAARAFASWPTVVIIPAVEPGTSPTLYKDCSDLADQMGKFDEHARATFVLLDTPGTMLANSAFDLTVGGLADPVLGDPGRREPVLWRAYVHARLAWEAAGDLNRALEWDTRSFRDIPAGADDLLENLLNQRAEETAGQLDEAVVQKTATFLRQMVARKGTAGGRNTSPDGLLQAGVFWRPPGESNPRPAPWMARALLLAEASPEASFYLRGCLVCAPLAREILSHCFDLESRQRAIGWAQRGTFRPPPEAEERFRRFQEKQPGSGAEFYPSGCPGMPADGWAFTVFGEFISSLPIGRQQLAAHHELRNLRNALAHGHYIGWQMVTTLRRIEQQLA